jgi:hypothetical protein
MADEIIKPEEKKPEEQPTEEKKEEVDCPTCRMDSILPAYAAAIAVCELMEDPLKQDHCKKVMEQVNPEKIKDGAEVIKNVLLEEGDSALESIGRYVGGFNASSELGTIMAVQQLLDEKKPVPPKLMSYFKQITARKPV